MKKLFFNIMTLIAATSIFVACEQKPTTPPEEPEEPKVSSLKPIFAEDGATLQGISRNGKWAVGYNQNNDANTGYTISASLWNLETGERTILATAEEGMSQANCVNDAGTIVGGAYLFQPAYHQNGEWHSLQLPEGFTMGIVKSMAEVDGQLIFVGYVQDNDEAQYLEAAKWVNGVYERANPKSLREDHLGEEALVNTCYNISEDGKIIMGSLAFTARPNTTVFVTTPDNAFIIDTKTNENKNLSFIFSPSMSANGKYITGWYRHVVFTAGSEFADPDIYQPFIYDVESKNFQMFEKEMEWGGWAVDNNGVVYANTPVETGAIRQGYIITNGEAVELEQMLLANGITQEQIDAVLPPAEEQYENKLGTIIAVSRDGKTIIGCAGKCSTYNWVAKLK